MSDSLRQTLIAMAGQKDAIVVHRAFVDFTGTLEAGMLLGQLLYWTPRAKIPGGWIAKSDHAWQDELCLSRRKVRAARETLEQMGILETEVHRFDGTPTVHYRLDLDALEERWTARLSQGETMDRPKVGQSIVPGRDDPSSQGETVHRPKVGQSLTETTTEITAETTPKTKNNRASWFSGLLTRAGVIFGSQLQVEQWMDLLELTDNNRLLESALEATAKQRKRPTPAYIRRIIERCLEQNCMPDQWPGRERSRASPQRQSSGAWEQW